MLKKREAIQSEAEFVVIDQLVPKDHLLRQIDRAFDFSFIYEKVEGLYSTTTGRPPVDPVVLFKCLFIGYLFGIRSERQLMREIEVNVAYRWFLGYNLTAKVPDHSTISQNRRRRFADSPVYQEIFDEIVLQAIEREFIDGKVLYTDSTHLKASANKNKFERKEVAKSTRDYLDELEAGVNGDREEHGKAPLPPKEPAEPETKQTRISTTDPQSGYMMREGKPEGFFYLDHRTVDEKHNLITDVHVTAGNVHDSIPYLERLDRQRKRFGFEVESVGLDAAYFTAPICKGLSERDIYGVMPYVRPGGKAGMFNKRDFIYDDHFDCYLCPQNEVLSYRTTGRDGNRQYQSDPKICRGCPLLEKCTTSRKRTKVISRHIWEHHKEAVQDHRYEWQGKRIYQRRKETVERSFADSKQLHGHRYARLRGQKKVSEQCLLAAACQNMKRIAQIEAQQLLSWVVRMLKRLDIASRRLARETQRPKWFTSAKTLRMRQSLRKPITA